MTVELQNPGLTDEEYIDMWAEQAEVLGVAISRMTEIQQERLKNLPRASQAKEEPSKSPAPLVKELKDLEIGDRLRLGGATSEITKIYPKRIHKKYEITAVISKKVTECSLEEIKEWGFKLLPKLQIVEQGEL